MTLAERIRIAEEKGFKLVGFYVAIDVYAALKSEMKALARTEEYRVEVGDALAIVSELCAPLGPLQVYPTGILPLGTISPKFELLVERGGAWRLGGAQVKEPG